MGAALALAAPICAQQAEASRYGRYYGYSTYGRVAARAIYAGVSHYSRYGGAYGGGYSYGGLQCVPYARENTGIELTGNAANWWENAAGIYERGARPEVGSVLNFRATGRMRMGHVAVVSNVVNSRSVQIDHANWSGRGVVTRNVTVVDVSPSNDWSAVRVALGNGDFGSVYPTYGFIYDRPDKGTMLANAGTVHTANALPTSVPVLAAASPVLNPAPLDLRPQDERVAVLLAPQQEEEVAEVADDARPYRARRGGAQALPVVHYGRGGAQAASYGRVELAQLGHGAERMTAGRMMGGQVLFIGRAAPRGGHEAGYGGRGYSHMVQPALARYERAEAHAAQQAHSHADNGSHRRGRRA